MPHPCDTCGRPVTSPTHAECLRCRQAAGQMRDCHACGSNLYEDEPGYQCQDCIGIVHPVEPRPINDEALEAWLAERIKLYAERAEKEQPMFHGVERR